MTALEHDSVFEVVTLAAEDEATVEVFGALVLGRDVTPVVIHAAHPLALGDVFRHELLQWRVEEVQPRGVVCRPVLQ